MCIAVMPIASCPLTRVQSTTISTSPAASPFSVSFSIPETEPEVESSPAGRRVVEETIVEDESEVQPQKEDIREIPDTFETGGTLSTAEASSRHRNQHSIQKEIADAQSFAQELIVQEIEYSIEEELRDVPQSTQPVQEFQHNTQAELQDVPQGTAQEVEPFAQPRSQSAHQSSTEESPGETPQSTRLRELQSAPQSALEKSPTREIPSTTQDQPQDTLRTSSQLSGRQSSQTASEEQTTLLDSSAHTSQQLQAQERQLQSEGSTSHGLAARLDEQLEASPEETEGLSCPRVELASEPLSAGRRLVHNTISLVPGSNNNSPQTYSHRQEIAKTDKANGDLPAPSSQSSSSPKQHTRLLPYSPVLDSQQQDSRAAITATKHHSDTINRLSRHDSSQESPSTSCESSSPVPQPPKLSLGTLDTNRSAPKRPATFANFSHNTAMNTHEHSPSPRQEVPRTIAMVSSASENPVVSESFAGSSGASEPPVPETTSEPQSFVARFEEERRKARARLGLEDKSSRTPGSRKSESGPRATPEVVEKTRSLDRLTAPEAGTRSPSTIPARLPVSQEPTSLRAVATSVPAPVPPPAQNHEEIAAEPQPEPKAAASSPTPQDVDMADALSSDNEEDESLLTDDLELQEDEYIVPLPIQGRQADTYRQSSGALGGLYGSRVHNQQEAQSKIEDILRELRSIETHVDLVRIGNSTPQPNDDQAGQDKHLVDWSNNNSIKFRFLGALLSRLQARDLHIILVIDEQNNARLFSILESFLRGVNFSFDSPSTGQSNTAKKEPYQEKKLLKITILPSNASPILREAHLIVCLDGKPNVTKLRKKPWALKADRSNVPCLQMVIPRTVGHIERYLSAKLDTKRRLDTIITTLSQFVTQGSVGCAVDNAPPRSYEVTYADEIVRFLLPSQDESALSEWPLAPLGNIKDDIEYQSQQSQDTLQAASPRPGPNAAGKRPLIQDDDRDDPAKRMRFTPQPQPQPHASTSHISDSEPGASVSNEQRLEWYIQENKRLCEVTDSYVKRQWLYEETSRKRKAMEIRAERAERERDAAKEREAKLREQFNTRIANDTEQRQQVEELRAVHLLSEDAKVRKIAEQSAEIERLKAEVAKEMKAKEEAITSKRSTETTLEYVQEQRRSAQSEAIAAAQSVEALTKANAKLERAAKAQSLLPNFDKRQRRLAEETIARQTAENEIQKKQNRVLAEKLKDKTTELERHKVTRGVGGGTRAASVGARTPRPGSRAASPLPNGRDRIANLRNG
jgi:hypothetical protein